MPLDLKKAKLATVRPFIVPGNYEGEIVDARYAFNEENGIERVNLTVRLENVEVFWPEQEEREPRENWIATISVANLPYDSLQAQLYKIVAEGLGIDGDGVVNLDELDYEPLKGKRVLVSVARPRESNNGQMFQNLTLRDFVAADTPF